MGKHYSNRERLDMVKKYRISGFSISEFARENQVNRSTFQDWLAAYKQLQGDFIQIDELNEKEGVIFEEDKIRINLLKEDEISSKSAHFNRFDHSIVVIETEKMKVTTSVEQALQIIGVIYDRL
jgi:transposase-like protein